MVVSALAESIGCREDGLRLMICMLAGESASQASVISGTRLLQAIHWLSCIVSTSSSSPCMYVLSAMEMWRDVENSMR